MLEAIKYQRGQLKILNQLLLFEEAVYIDIKGTKDAWTAINSMQIRGAPAIAILGCLSLAIELHEKNFATKDELVEFVNSALPYLVSARPTAVNMKNAARNLQSISKDLLLDDETDVEDMKQRLISTIEKMLEKDLSDNRAIGHHGAQAIQLINPENRVRILTHCNTGSLATSGYGTALGVIRSLNQSGELERAYCTETRPYNQGARLTSYELVHDNIPSTFICDDMAGALMKLKNISAVVVGADRIAANGDTANKIGTYQLAILAKFHGIPFYVAAPFSSVDFTIKSGTDIPIEERPEVEMTHLNGKRIVCPGIKCWNPAFDVTPADLITAIITEKGVLRPDQLQTIDL